jgi:membrane-bound lytic murein transglycosylase D
MIPMKIKHTALRLLAGVLTLFLVACTSSIYNKTPTKNLAVAENSAAQVPTHPIKMQAVAPPPKKKFFLFDGHYDDVWKRIRADFRLDHSVENPRVQAHIRWFQNHPDYVERVTQRASPYIYLIVEELDRRNMPKEVALLPMVESAFNPLAYSPMRAAGLWQMMPGTARGYGIQMNNYYDGRRDIYAATNSALDYLSKLSNDFAGDWLLVFAAYNTGEGNVGKAIDNNKRSNKNTNYWSLRLHSETHEYVPRLLALSHIIKNAENYGIKLPYVPNQPHVQMVNVGKQISLDLAAQLAEMSLYDLKQYNPGYTSWATSPTGPHVLMLPKSAAEKFTTNLASLPANHQLGIDESRNVAVKAMPITAPSKNGTYIVKSGDNLWTISKKYKISANQLAELNNLSIKTPLKVGQKLKIKNGTDAKTTLANNKSKNIVPKVTPKKDIVATEKNSNSKQSLSAKEINTTGIYAVKQGDSIYKIAKQFGVSQKDLLKWNKIGASTKLKIGQKLRVANG